MFRRNRICYFVFVSIAAIVAVCGCKKEQVPIMQNTGAGTAMMSGTGKKVADTSYVMERKSWHVTAFARDGSKMIQVGDYLYLYGGWKGFDSTSVSYNDVYRSNGGLGIWQRMPDAPWGGRHTFGLSKIDSTVYVYGGDINMQIFDVWKSTDGINFRRVMGDLTIVMNERLLYGTCVHNNKLFVIGGQSSIDYEDEGLTDIWTSPNGAFWTQIATNIDFIGKNISGAVASFNNRIWVVGGGYYGSSDPAKRWTNHIYSSADGISWRQEPDAPWPARQYGDVCVWDDKLWVIGGNNGQNLNDIWYMNKEGIWNRFETPDLFTPRHASAVTVYNDQLVMACGDLNNECWTIRKKISY